MITVTFLAVKPVVGAEVKEIVYMFADCPKLVKQDKINMAIDKISKSGFVVLKFREE